MKLRCITLSLFLILGWKVSLANLQEVSFTFYSEQILLNYDSDMMIKQRITVEEKELLRFYEVQESRPYAPLLNDLLAYKEQLQLNDWLFYELLKKSVDEIFTGFAPKKRELTAWFLLSKSGYNTRLAYLRNKVITFAQTDDDIFEVPLIEEDGKTFVNLSGIYEQKITNEPIYLLGFIPNPNGKALSFYLKKLPSFTPKKQKKQLEFWFQQANYKLNYQIDHTIIDLMKSYPFISEKEYLEVPLSPTLAESLLPQLKSLLKDKADKEALEMLVTLTRSSFRYKEDKEHFGRSKPMIADEVFFYPYSDCEDRSALFYALVKELLQLPMVIIAYDDHLTIGVASSQFEGDFVRYRGEKYYICDPTGPTTSSRVGRFPEGYQNKSYEIIGQYQQQ